nr:MarR family winged helix-turn-helix transcriptional regulator [Kibdelosporangium sp. MJ126-NF4]CEL16493.1 Transcriptional regulator, MarR family [Kibdelosporangium sp. MJ126-NF4]CTQ90445.1 Transcriptional regulator, MarR family [Kibdelosporangium sp. MJ126-NF4]
MSRLENLLGAQSLALADHLLDADIDGAAAMPGSERAALVTLLAHPDRSVRWLGDVLGLTSSGGTRLVDRLVAAGWATRTTGQDARSRHVRLTRSGRARARRVLGSRQAVLTAALSVLSAQERDQLESLLDKVVSGLAETRLPALRVCRLCDRDACAAQERQCPLEHTVSEDDPYG